jgi:hypothetical protein
MKYAVEKGSGTMMYIPSLIKNSGIQKLIVGDYHTESNLTS